MLNKIKILTIPYKVMFKIYFSYIVFKGILNNQEVIVFCNNNGVPKIYCYSLDQKELIEGFKKNFVYVYSNVDELLDELKEKFNLKNDILYSKYT